MLGALLGFAGVVLLAFGRGLSFTGAYALGYALALGCAFTWSLYSVLSRRFGETPTDAIAAFCAASARAVARLPLLFERTVWPASPTAWLAVLALGLGPAGAAFYLWDHAVKRGDIRALGALSYATPILSTALLIVCGLAEPTSTLLIAAAAGHGRRRARFTRAVASLVRARVPAQRGDSKPANSKAGDTVQPTSVQAPSERAACQTLARHDGLRLLADAEVGAETQVTHAVAIVAQRQFQRRAGIVMPDLVGIDLVPVRAFAGLQQEVDRRAAPRGFGRTEGLDDSGRPRDAAAARGGAMISSAVTPALSRRRHGRLHRRQSWRRR